MLLRRLALALALVFTSALARANVPALATALDGAGLVWTTGGNSLWTSQNTVTHDGVDAARAIGVKTADSQSWVQTTVTGPGVLTWHWRLDLLAEDNGSLVELIVGDESSPRQMLTYPGTWTPGTLVLDAPGSVNIRWRLLRLFDTPSTASPADVAYLDTVAYSPFGPLVLQSPTAVTARGFTVRWNALPHATDYLVEIATAANFSDARTVGFASAPATSFLLTNLEPLTTYHYRVVAYGPEAISATSAPASITTPAVSRPANDAFANATALSNASGSVAATTLDATLEAAEPFAHQASVWFRWTAPTAGRWRFETAGLGQPLLLLYTGTSLGELDLLAISSPGSNDGVAVLEFDAEAGASYRLALDAGASAQGATTLSWQRLALHAPPANDAFATPTPLTGLSGSVAATNLHATAEPGEPAPAARSVWFRWVAPESGHVTFDASGGAIATTLSVWSGSALGALTLLGSDSAALPAGSRVSVPVVKNVAYRVSLDGQDGAQGALALAWSLAVPTLPQTITVAPVAELPVYVASLPLDATASSGLPVAFTIVSSSPAGIATLDGDTLVLAGKPGTVTLRASQPGDTTHLPAAPVTFSITVRAPPANDTPSGATLLTGKNGLFEGDLRYATGADTDPFPGNHGIWLRWTAPGNGRLTLDTAGSATPVALSVLTGSSPANLAHLDADIAGAEPARLVLPLSSGTQLWIALDTLSDTPGAVRLAWSFADAALEQTIDFPALPDIGLQSAPILLEASASSALPVAFTLVSTSPAGIATLDGELLSLAGKAGTITVRATQPGDADHLPAPPVTRTFAVRPPPANDHAADAAVVTGLSGAATGSNIDSTTEAFDPFPANHSVWWRWTAAATGIWTVDTAASQVPVALSLLTGATPGSLTLLDTDAPVEGRGLLSIPVSAGQTYWLVLDTLDNRTGSLHFTWNLAAPTQEQTIAFDQDLPDLIVGDPAPLLTPTASSGLPVVVAVVSGPARIESGVLVLTEKAGLVTLRATQPGDAYHKPAPPVTRTFNVAALPSLTITLGDLRQTYTGTGRPVSVGVSPEPRLRPLLVTYNGGAAVPVRAGTYDVVATADDTRVTAKLVIDKAPLSITALDARRLAGEPNPAFRFSYSGFVGNDDSSALARLPVGTTTAKITSPGGVYPIRASGAAANDYTITYSPGVLTVESLAARYEALLFDANDALPVGKIELAVAASGAPFTGRLDLADQPAAISLRGRLTLDSEADTGEASLRVVRGARVYDLRIRLALGGGFTAAIDRDGSLHALAPLGVRLFAPAPREKLAWSGTHTALLLPASAVSAEAPAGAGHATAVIDTKGRMKFAGRLADDAPFTGTLAPDESGAYRLFARPYAKRLHSHLAGDIPLADHPDAARFPGRRYLPAAAAARLVWQKAALPSNTSASRRDKSYRSGIAALELPLLLDPWLPPVAKPAPVTLLDRLALSADPGPANLVIGFGPADIGLGDLGDALPATARLAPGGALTVLTPSTIPANATKFTFKLAPKTGVFSGGFTLGDQLAPPPAKPVVRKVKFRGVLRQRPDLESETDTLVGAGAFLLAPAGVSGAQTDSGEIRLIAP